MPPEKFKRKLSAILSADVKGYSRLMGEDEESTVRTLQEYKEVMASSIQHHRGRIVGGAGDSLLAEFSSVVDAVQCAVEIQQVLKAKNTLLPEDRRMEFRIGINLGDVIEEGDTIYGDGVNIAARLEGLAEPGGVWISESAYQQIENKLPLRYDYVGEHAIKNIAKPVRVYRAQIEAEGASSKVTKEKKPGKKYLSWPVLAIVAVIAGGITVWQVALRPAPPPREVASREKMAHPLPGKPSVAVLPFVNMSGEKEQEYFSDGITEDLITDLSKISGLLVIARNSTFNYKGKSVKVKQVAEELGVRYVLEGSVRKAGDEIRINAQLIDALSGHHLWAERYDGTMSKIFALQDQITKKIVSALAVKLTGREEELVGQKGTNNAAAYNAYLEGWDHYNRFTPESLAKAVTCFKKAIELDPKYDQVYTALAMVYWTGASNAAMLRGLEMVTQEAQLRSREYLQKAMKHPTSTAYNVSSRMYLARRQHKEAISEVEKGLAIDPNGAGINAAVGWALVMAGRPKDGVEYYHKSMRLDPGSRRRYLGGLSWAHFCMGEIAEAVGLAEQELRLNPEDLGINLRLAAFYGILGRDQEARAALATYGKKLMIAPLNFMMTWSVPFGDRAVADRYEEGLLKAGVRGQPSGYLPAFQENQLTGEQIKALLFGSTITAHRYVPQSGKVAFLIDWKNNGECTWRQPNASYSDRGKSRIEGDMICTQYQNNWWGLENCATVFKNPSGTPKTRDEYFWVNEIGFQPFSVIR